MPDTGSEGTGIEIGRNPSIHNIMEARRENSSKSGIKYVLAT